MQYVIALEGASEEAKRYVRQHTNVSELTFPLSQSVVSLCNGDYEEKSVYIAWSWLYDEALDFLGQVEDDVFMHHFCAQNSILQLLGIYTVVIRPASEKGKPNSCGEFYNSVGGFYLYYAENLEELVQLINYVCESELFF